MGRGRQEVLTTRVLFTYADVMALRANLILDDELEALLQAEARRTGRPFDEALREALRRGLGEGFGKQAGSAPFAPFKVRPKALRARPGFDFDDVEGLLERLDSAPR